MMEHGDGMKVTVKGKALEDGYQGENIRVRQTHIRRKDYIGQVNG